MRNKVKKEMLLFLARISRKFIQYLFSILFIWFKILKQIEGEDNR